MIRALHRIYTRYTTEKIRLRFTVNDSKVLGAYYAVKAQGIVEIARISDGSIARTYIYTASSVINYNGAYTTGSASGIRQTCGIINGETWCWGVDDDSTGKLGNGTFDSSSTPVRVVRQSGVLEGKIDTNVAVGNNFACVVADGSVYCWGKNDLGQLGRGTTSTVGTPYPGPVSLPVNLTFVEVVAGGCHACARATNGRSKSTTSC